MAKYKGIIRALLASLALGAISVPSYAQNFKVGAFYFGVFNPQNAQTYLGSSDQWVGVRPLSQKSAAATPWVGETFGHLQPALGFYDNSSPAVLEKQIRQAKAAGLSYFNFYWYWNSALNGSNGGEEIEEGLTAFLKAKNREDLDFALSITAHPWQNLGIPATQYTAVVSTLISKYITKNNYLRTPTDKRPIIFLLDTRGIGVSGAVGNATGTSDEVSKFVDQLRTAVINQTGKNPFIVVNTELDYLNSTTRSKVDGYSCGGVYGLALDSSEYVGSMTKYNNLLTTYLGGFAASKPLIPCSMVDFNEKARYYGSSDLSKVRYLRDWDINKLSNNLTQLKNFSNNLPSTPVSKHITLYAWNEWHEGGVNIEPSALNGDRQLALISSTFGLSTQGDANCKKYGDCTHNISHPTGTLDLANCSVIAGWSRDADTAAPTKIHVYKNGPWNQGGVFVGEYVADQVRVDLPFRDQTHGFSVPTPAAFKTGTVNSVWVYGIDTNANGDVANVGASNILLNLSGRTLQCNP